MSAENVTIHEYAEPAESRTVELPGALRMFVEIGRISPEDAQALAATGSRLSQVTGSLSEM